MSSPEPTTEAVHPDSADLDRISSTAIAELMNAGDAEVVRVVGTVAETIGQVIDAVAERLRAGGRLFYVGAGTSGRLGILDASECPPTFSTDPEQVQGVIAGGEHAIQHPVEGAEDSPEQGAADLRGRGVSGRDAVVGIAASGSTPYVLGAIEHARAVQAFTSAITCNAGSPLAARVELPVVAVVGPELLAGSTRLKAGTATKMILNMISTGAMVRIGKTYGNLMVDLTASNRKLVARSLRLLCRLTGLDAAAGRALLDRCDGELKTSVVAARHGLDAAAARSHLEGCRGQLRRALESAPAR